MKERDQLRTGVENIFCMISAFVNKHVKCWIFSNISACILVSLFREKLLPRKPRKNNADWLNWLRIGRSQWRNDVDTEFFPPAEQLLALKEDFCSSELISNSNMLRANTSTFNDCFQFFCSQCSVINEKISEVSDLKDKIRSMILNETLSK